MCATVELSMLRTIFGSLVVRLPCITAVGEEMARKKALEMRELDTTLGTV